MLKKIFDITLSMALLLILLVPFIIFGLIIKYDSPGPIIYWSNRIGLDNKVFLMPKFRSMKVDSPPLATHLLSNPNYHITKIGRFIRKYSIDELPQLWCILTGTMSFVGPRPALFNQKDLIDARTNLGLHRICPGITGWAQINGRDNLSLNQKIFYDYEYLMKRSFSFDLYIIFITAKRVLFSLDVSH